MFRSISQEWPWSLRHAAIRKIASHHRVYTDTPLHYRRPQSDTRERRLISHLFSCIYTPVDSHSVVYFCTAMRNYGAFLRRKNAGGLVWRSDWPTYALWCKWWQLATLLSTPQTRCSRRFLAAVIWSSNGDTVACNMAAGRCHQDRQVHAKIRISHCSEIEW